MEQINLNKKQTSRKKYFSILAVVLFIVFTFAYAYWSMVLQDTISTDDAYVVGNANPISAQVSGSVIVVNNKDTSFVRQGNILVSLDKTDATIALNKAKNNLANIVRETHKLYLQDKQYNAEVASARIQYQQSLEDYQRRLPLAKNGVISKETLEHAKDTLVSNKAGLNAAILAYNANKALVMDTPLNRQPQVIQAADAAKEAWLALQRTDIRSPVTGYISQRSVQVGQTISPGQSLMAVVPAHQMWVNANFKETQLTNIRIGQPVNIISDLYGEDIVFHGHIVGIKMGTGNAFSLLPAQNATGNWIKVVQRVPVDVSLDPKELQQHPLRIGLSMTATIDTKNEDIGDMPVLASAVTAMPAYVSKALVIDTSPIEKEIKTIISRNGQM
ncbi:EmrA/EmrK family multidrug efflux transporter periplasmic adaptor subunit [Yersinia vastinensis]|uniref:EmrA/EmrK family multidrug efflux transporter periplasmic adaptor subunit n=1 Tax=Yersinia vastinensis TaxID=2890318 RepID=UPI0005E25642|nr:EmrA/EmrK family multidrug efflux transporter periplasmic adaptor subunit [Yersinia vastinensis]OVZ97229.1 EmrA/EmrK family multidrug efflux transporter periplasmic adaptor subunit [Yersinia frederiksenii]CNI18587.1 multidrug resistance protein A [Yersinia frederiksenii]CNI56840.1 multidrug resistance protein A [Yersinia frederiksenii]CNK86389.1 multidrug resistance protein A [Yersinia frederiksenii]